MAVIKKKQYKVLNKIPESSVIKNIFYNAIIIIHSLTYIIYNNILTKIEPIEHSKKKIMTIFGWTCAVAGTKKKIH